jgi:hypothetical protein
MNTIIIPIISCFFCLFQEDCMKSQKVRCISFLALAMAGGVQARYNRGNTANFRGDAEAEGL